MPVDPNTGLPTGSSLSYSEDTGLPGGAKLSPPGTGQDEYEQMFNEAKSEWGKAQSERNTQENIAKRESMKKMRGALTRIHAGSANNEDYATAFGYNPEDLKDAFPEGSLNSIYKLHKDYINNPEILPLASGLAEGLNRVPTGLLQLATRAQKLLTLGKAKQAFPPEAADLYAKVTQLGRDNAKNTGKFGEFLRRYGDVAGQVAPWLLMPEAAPASTLGGAIARGAATGFAAGTTAGALEPVETNPEDPNSFLRQKAIQTGFGGTIGGVTGGLLAPLSHGINAFVNAKNGAYASKFQGLTPDVVKAGPEGGAPAVSKALSVENPAFDFEQTLARAMSDPANPYQSAANSLISEVSSEVPIGANPFGNNTSAKLQQSMRGQLLKNKIELHDSYNKLGKLYDQYLPEGVDVSDAVDSLRNLHKELTGVPVENAPQAAMGNPNVNSKEARLIQKWIADLSPKGGEESKLVWNPMTNQLERSNVQSFNKPASEVQEILSDMKREGFRGKISKSVTFGKHADTVYDAQGALEDSFKNHLAEAGKPELWSIQKELDRQWGTNVHGYDKFADLLDPEKTPPEAFTKALMEGNADNQRRAVSTLTDAYNRLDTTGKKLWGQALVERAMDKAVDNGSLVNFGKLDPALHGLENARMVLPADQQKLISGYVNLLKSDIERASKPGAGMVDIAAAKHAPIDMLKRVSNPFFRTPLGRNLLIGAADNPPGTPAFITNVLLKNQMPRWGAAAIAQRVGLKSNIPNIEDYPDVDPGEATPPLASIKEEPPMGAQIRHEGKIKTWTGKGWE